MATTKRSDSENWIIGQWQHNCGYASAVFSGFEPDAAHQADGGYHCSVDVLNAHGNGNDYSNSRPDDRNFNKGYGSAIDMSMSPADMIKCHGRVRAVFNDTSDPRRRYINAINTWDGSGDAVRLDMASNTASFATADHKWHNHQETRRRYNTDWTAADAIVSVLKGETKAAYIARTTTVAPPTPPIPEAGMAKLVAISDGPHAGGLYVSDGCTRRWVPSSTVLGQMAAAGLVVWPAAYATMTGAEADPLYGPDVEGLHGPEGPAGGDMTEAQIKEYVAEVLGTAEITLPASE